MPIRSLVLNLLALFLTLLAPLAAALAQNPDAEGARDHPAVARFPGFFIDEHEANDFNEAEFIVGEDKTVTKGGKFWRFVYLKQDKARTPSVVEVIRNYESAFRRNGGSMVWSSTRDGKAVYRQSAGAQERWMSLRVEVDADYARIDMVIIDVAAMTQKVEFSAADLLDALNRDGFVALQGIRFETGKDTIRPESEPQLAEIRALLDANRGLRLSVEGHTDNVGAPTANLALSRRRAEAVRNWLIGKGIAANRLTTQGYGDTRPVADNRTDAGRAQNRRVELVRPKP